VTAITLVAQETASGCIIDPPNSSLQDWVQRSLILKIPAGDSDTHQSGRATSIQKAGA
jgi:hypothetical protein